MNLLVNCLQDGALAAVACTGYAVVSRPTKAIVIVAIALAAVGRMGRFLLQYSGMGIATASLGAAMLIALCSIPVSRRLHIPAEMFVFPALVPMIPGVFAYRATLTILQFLREADGFHAQSLLVQFFYNATTAFFIMGALAIGASMPLLLLRRESPLGKAVRRLRHTSGKIGD